MFFKQGFPMCVTGLWYTHLKELDITVWMKKPSKMSSTVAQSLGYFASSEIVEPGFSYVHYLPSKKKSTLNIEHL